MYAYDIACIKWQSFSVYTPKYFDIYVIEKVWYDSRLWDYVILKHWEYRFVYWHTKTNIKEWTLLKPYTYIWDINKSGMSENYHLHIELWKWNDNIKFEFIYGKWLYINDKSFDLRNQRWLVSDKEINDITFDFISHHEWFRLNAYEDWLNSDWSIRYSICYWTKSYKWAKETEANCKKYLRLQIQSIAERYELRQYPINVQVAVTSFVYNIWSLTKNQQSLLKQGYYKALGNSFKQFVYFTNSKWEKSKALWLVKRREAEFILLTT